MFLGKQKAHTLSSSKFLPLLCFLAMTCSIIFMGIVLPLRGLYFYAALLDTQLGSWLLLPTRLLFPQAAIIWPVHYIRIIPAPTGVAWKECAVLFLSLLILFGFYMLAVRLVPQLITLRFILYTTVLFGLVCVLFPAITSQDIFSYIAYARMGIVYHLNPLTALPSAITADPVYPYIYWVHQPSAYGPTWALIACALQWLALVAGFKNVLAMVLLLRLFGLAIHLASILLIWQLSGSLQHNSGSISQTRRLRATLAFAWNPLLLFEACVNAHNDTTILFFVLIAIWCLQISTQKATPLYLATAFFLALAACLKVTLIVLMPALLLYLWMQRPRRIQSIIATIVVYVSTILLLYAPFWQHGMALHVFQVNPGVTRDVNGPYEFLTHLYESVRGRPFPFISSDVGAPIEVSTHRLSMLIFVLLYAILCLRFLMTRHTHLLNDLVKFMSIAWLFYCLIGSPWFWPWYLTAFFGLFALIEATGDYPRLLFSLLRLPLATRLLTIPLLGLYIFATWTPHELLIPGLPYFQMTYLRGLWLCLIPLLALRPATPIALVPRTNEHPGTLPVSYAEDSMEIRQSS